MRRFLKILSLPAIIGALLVIPFMILELVNRRGLHEDYPIGLFGLLWLLAVVFVLILMPLVRSVRARDLIVRRPIGLLLRIGSLGLIAWMWFGIVLDQMPCFLGVPLCD